MYSYPLHLATPVALDTIRAEVGREAVVRRFSENRQEVRINVDVSRLLAHRHNDFQNTTLLSPGP